MVAILVLPGLSSKNGAHPHRLADPESHAALIPIDDASYFACIERGCWNRVRRDMSWSEVAADTQTNEQRLRDGNPQLHGDRLHAGDQIRISQSMQADP